MQSQDQRPPLLLQPLLVFPLLFLLCCPFSTPSPTSSSTTGILLTKLLTLFASAGGREGGREGNHIKESDAWVVFLLRAFKMYKSNQSHQIHPHTQHRCRAIDFPPLIQQCSDDVHLGMHDETSHLLAQVLALSNSHNVRSCPPMPTYLFCVLVLLCPVCSMMRAMRVCVQNNFILNDLPFPPSLHPSLPPPLLKPGVLFRN